MLLLEDMNGVTLKLGDRVSTKNGKEAYVIKVEDSSGKIRIRLRGGLIRKVCACEVARY